jgi:tRNA modification GTPase
MTSAHDQTIAALSTPIGESGIAVIRISGGEALAILSGLFRTMDGAERGGEWEHRRLYHGRVVGVDGETIDEVVCGVMRGPESYTGEDTVEISCHGNTVIISRLLGAAYAVGARAAEPGEFTKRAFLNGKLDLIQAEAVGDLIHARSELQRRVAHDQLEGGLSSKINALADELLGLLGIVEANIDFIEEGIETIDYADALNLVRAHRGHIDELLGSARFSRPFHEGFRVGIAGPVNAGKSSIFNRLVGESRAIVTEIPGTTRDVLREPIVLEGLLFIIQDTAGLRGTTDRVERIGVDLAESTVGQSDIVLFTIDASVPVDLETRARVEALDPEKTVLALNKIDLPPAAPLDTLKKAWPDRTVIPVSAQTGEGIADLTRALVERVGRDGLDWVARERVVLNTRLVSLLEGARDQLGALEKGLGGRAPLEILALDTREALSFYERATGKRYSDDLLDTIFTRFCIGK